MPPDHDPTEPHPLAPSPTGRGGDAGAEEIVAVGAFLRALAERAERDPDFGRQIAALLAETGLHPTRTPSPSITRPLRARAGRAPATPPDSTLLPDPFALLREHGEANLRERLEVLDLAALRQIIRAYRLDPARISARWTNRERLVALIADQVRARADHGKAFARV